MSIVISYNLTPTFRDLQESLDQKEEDNRNLQRDLLEYKQQMKNNLEDELKR